MLVSWNLRAGKTVGSSMRLLLAGILALMTAGSGVGFAQTSGTCADPFQVPLKSGGSVSIASRAASIQITGGDQQFLRVTCILDKSADAREVSLHVSGEEHFTSLRVRGGPSNHVEIKIEVPRNANLKIEMAAGEIKIGPVTGDKIVDLHAGNVQISGMNAPEYRTASASVKIGDLSAAAFEVRKSGFFSSFSHETRGGHYRLRVSVGTGAITLE
jgi:hypothetical protein